MGHLDALPVTIGRAGPRGPAKIGSPHGGITVMPGDRRLQILAVAHLALGVVTSLLAHVELFTPFGLRHILIVSFLAMALCQALLLSLWGVASQARPWKRVTGLATGAVYLEALVANDLRGEFLGTSTITVAVTTAFLLVLRWLGFRFIREADPGQPALPEPEGLRFSIRGLMIFTAAVALLCAVAIVQSVANDICQSSSAREGERNKDGGHVQDG